MDAARLVVAAGCGAAVLVLLAAEARRATTVRAAAKAAASLAFLAVAALGLPAGDGAFARWLIAGQALGVVGDLALLGRGPRAFLVGLGAFLLGHLAYVAAFAALAPPARWPALGALGALPLVAGGGALAWLWPHLRRAPAMRGPVIAYVAVIATMVVAALAVADQPGLAAPVRHRVLVGALAFFASDLAVARDRFVADGLANKVWGLPAYYGGQLLLALSVAAG